MYQTEIDQRCQGVCSKCEYMEICEARKLSLMAEEQERQKLKEQQRLFWQFRQQVNRNGGTR